MEIADLQQWLADRERSYTRGLALFRTLADDGMKQKFLAFFNEVEDVPSFDSHHTVLVNKLSTIARLYGSQGLVSKRVFNDSLLKGEKEGIEKNGESLMKDILLKESEYLNLKERIDNLESSAENSEYDIDSLNGQLNDLQFELQAMQDRYNTLRPGAKIVTFTSLPNEMKQKFERVRKITPLYAQLFTEMQNESLTDEQREPIAHQAYDLWIERDQLWQDLDNWAEGKEVTMIDNNSKSADSEETELLKGMKIAQRIERLKENIHRAETSIEMHEQNGKQNMKLKAEKRLEAYRSELAILERIES